MGAATLSDPPRVRIPEAISLMQITDIWFEKLYGRLAPEYPMFEERLIRPIDVYPEHRAESAAAMSQDRFEANDDGTVDVTTVICHVETDVGISGLAGPCSVNEAFFVRKQLLDLLRGEDPLATERAWDKMYRYLIHGRKGEAMFAVAAVDSALWDIRGKAAGLPLYRLLGGPVRKSFPAYASALGFSIELEDAARVAKGFVDQGFTATKWFVRNGPMEGEPGARKNLELAGALRSAVGDDVEIMIDAWSSWDVRYAIDMGNRLAEHRVRWIEEVVKADDIPGQAEVRRRSATPVSGGEHEYTRWGAREYLEAKAVDLYQADTIWAGGVSEMMKIFALCSAYGVPLIPHGGSVPINAHLTAAVSPTDAPYIEYLVQWNEFTQFFWKNPTKPVNGYISPTDDPGLGLEIDEEKVISRQRLDY